MSRTPNTYATGYGQSWQHQRMSNYKAVLAAVWIWVSYNCAIVTTATPHVDTSTNMSNASEMNRSDFNKTSFTMRIAPIQCRLWLRLRMIRISIECYRRVNFDSENSSQLRTFVRKRSAMTNDKSFWQHQTHCQKAVSYKYSCMSNMTQAR